MFKLIWLTSLLLAGLTACTSNFVPSKVDSNGEYIGWHCEADVNSQELWHCSKKTMKEGVPADMPAAPGEYSSDPVMTGSVIAEPLIVESAPGVASAQPRPQVSSGPRVRLKGGFTIQIGAYADRQVAESVVEALAVQVDIRIVDIVVKGQGFSAVVLGHYSSLEEAQQAADQLLKEQSSYWIRSMRSLSDAAVE